MWSTNAHLGNIASSAYGGWEPRLILAKAYYDASVEVVSIRFRDGEVKYVIEGSGNFTIFADENGIWGVDLEVKRWAGSYREVVDAFRRIKAEVKA